VTDSKIQLKTASMTGFPSGTIRILHRLPRAAVHDLLECRGPKAGVETGTQNKFEQGRRRKG
jgi:hypothetical protein